jgi:Ala-tRNA(Pro) deacylase
MVTQSAADAYTLLLARLDAHHASYRLIDHPPEGRTELVSPMRGHPVGHAAKCIVVMAKIGKKVTKYFLVVVPGDARVDLAAIKSLAGATYVGFASPEIAEQLARSVVGTVLPFSFDERLELIVDPEVLVPPEIYFNAARLDRSIALASADYRRIANPRLERVAVSTSPPLGSDASSP